MLIFYLISSFYFSSEAILRLIDIKSTSNKLVLKTIFSDFKSGE